MQLGNAPMFMHQFARQHPQGSPKLVPETIMCLLQLSWQREARCWGSSLLCMPPVHMTAFSCILGVVPKTPVSAAAVRAEGGEDFRATGHYSAVHVLPAHDSNHRQHTSGA